MQRCNSRRWKLLTQVFFHREIVSGTEREANKMVVFVCYIAILGIKRNAFLASVNIRSSPLAYVLHC